MRDWAWPRFENHHVDPAHDAQHMLKAADVQPTAAEDEVFVAAVMEAIAPLVPIHYAKPGDPRDYSVLG